ncbi:MAG: LytTR family DNA-binding domain-containing protein [Casimicrobiaceae bacterium]|nr:LytTR family DNA-binding domain-containing protein [Casimicrobiaceae bacterium]MCX8098864.1 LytTR family DNA-binding domain-containing protein [Casimicrobiaceae bacterium]MDW8311485.1 LytTR family DNA-binding domain-containing protein [Burkholderiales bacterium]
MLPQRSDASRLTVIVADDEPLARHRLIDLLEDLQSAIPTQIVAQCETGRAVVEAAQRGADLVLLDIRMPDMDGIEAARHLLKLPRTPKVIFVTAYEQHAIEAFEVQAVDYLLKPVRRDRLLAAIERVQPLTQAQVSALPAGARRYFSVTERGRLVLVPSTEVLYLRAEMKYITLVTAKREYLIEDSLTRIEEEFGGRFLRIHRNCLVLAEAIETFERQRREDAGEKDGEEAQWVVTLRGLDVRLPVSRRQHAEVRRLAQRVQG